LAQIAADLASRTIIPPLLLSLIFILLALIIGRAYCGFICPLGLLIELFSSFTPHRGRFRFYRLKYYHLIVILILAGFGFYAAQLDPIVSLTRGIGGIRTGAILPSLILAIILYLSLLESRFFCRHLCPLGGLFGLLARISIFKLRMAECRECYRCEKVCPTGAIEKNRINWSECILCLKCLDSCPDQALSFRTSAQPARVDLSRRNLILAGISSLFLIPILKARGRVIRPPGSIPEELFIKRCLRCGNCIEVCPTSGLRYDHLTFFTPMLVPREGGCERFCTSCGEVCPTGAIRRLPLLEKEFCKIGTAVIDRSRCLAWRRDRSCLICDEACPYGAISFQEGKPIVDPDLCIGCGLCEWRCPLEGRSAIVVHPDGEERKLTGSYRSQKKIEKRKAALEEAEELPEGFIQ